MKTCNWSDEWEASNVEPLIRTLVNRIKEIYKFHSEEEADRIISGIDEFGLFSDAPATIKDSNIFDTLCQQLAQLLNFKPG